MNHAAIGSYSKNSHLIDKEQESVSIHESENRVVTPISGHLAFDRVTFAYPSRKEVCVLNEVSFHVLAGEKVAVVGPSGTGKSTLAALVLRFYDPQGGAVLFDGEDARTYRLTDIRN